MRVPKVTSSRKIFWLGIASAVVALAGWAIVIILSQKMPNFPSLFASLSEFLASLFLLTMCVCASVLSFVSVIYVFNGVDRVTGTLNCASIYRDDQPLSLDQALRVVFVSPDDVQVDSSRIVFFLAAGKIRCCRQADFEPRWSQ
jgi:hypothetical protein